MEAIIFGKRHTLDILSVEGRRVRYRYDGAELEADVESLPSGSLSLLLDTSQLTVGVRVREEGFSVDVAGRSCLVEVVDSRHQARAGADAIGSGPFTLKAPMPGKIISILTAEGQEVAAGQGILIIEAMKMQNELRAPRAGKVSRILVAEGDSVETKGRLLTIE